MGLGFWNSRVSADLWLWLIPVVSNTCQHACLCMFWRIFCLKSSIIFLVICDYYEPLQISALFLMFFCSRKVSSARACERFVRCSLKNNTNSHRYARRNAQRTNPHRLARRLFTAPKPSQGRTGAFSRAKTFTGSHGAISALEGSRTNA